MTVSAQEGRRYVGRRVNVVGSIAIDGFPGSPSKVQKLSLLGQKCRAFLNGSLRLICRRREK